MARARGRAHPALRPFHPIVREWFRETLGTPSAPQQQGWPAIARGEHTLILAPTGTGKTLSAFLWELNALITDGLDTPLANAVHLLYVSPLKALNNDIQRNLEGPLAQLQERFAAAGQAFPELRVAVRTGDTPASARARMLRKAPHILITTPESLHIMLTTVRGRGMFSGVRAVIVDEIHAIAGTKRGAHLALTLERLEHVSGRAPQRIGLSATQKPLEEIARFLGGSDVGYRTSGRLSVEDDVAMHSDPRPPTPDFRPVTIVDCGLVKKTEVRVQSPVADLGRVGGTIWPAVAPLVLAQVRDNRTTIVFVNNRAQAEKMAARLNALAQEEIALPYHGSLSRERRLTLERSLKAGQVRALVSTSALELGIDIGTVDAVIQLQSPKRVSSGLQRLGRAGHSLEAVSRGVFVPTFRDDGMEMLAIVRAMGDGDVEPTRVVQNALDVLAQVIVAATAVEDWTSAALFELVRRAYPYHRLSREAFDEVLAMLAGKYPSDIAAELDARLTWDRVTDRITATRASRLVAIMNGGTIPDRGLYTVNLPDRTRLGELDEEFVHETRVGDVFQLGSSTWRVQTIEHDRVIVIPAPGAPARMPFWHGEYAARSMHLTPRVGELRRVLAAVESDADIERVARDYQSDVATVRSLATYVREQRAATGVVPDDRVLVAEHFRDETGAVRVVLHAPFGGRVNAPWGMALAQRFRDALRVEVQVQTTDDGIMLRLSNLDADPPMQLLHGLTPEEATQRITEEVGDSSLFGARFRMNAGRALLLPRGSPRRRMPLWLQRLKAQDLLEAVREFPSFPILVETYRDVLQDAFDLPALRQVLKAVGDGQIGIRTVAAEQPSPMAMSLQFGFVMDWMYADDTPRAERAAAMLSLDTALLEDLMGTPGELEENLASALQEVLARRRGTDPARRARTPDELAMLLDRAGDLTVEELTERVTDDDATGAVLSTLLKSGRVVGLDVRTASGPARRLVLVESLPRYISAFGAPAFVYAGERLDHTTLEDAVPEAFRVGSLTATAARREVLARFLALSGPVTLEEVRARYDFGTSWLERRLGELTERGALLRGRFSLPGYESALRWCSRRVVEQARRRALAAARKEIEAVGFRAFALFQQRWQHAAPGTQTDPVSALRQLYGIARPPLAWEADYLAARCHSAPFASHSEPFASHSEPFASHSEPFASHSEPFASHSERSEESRNSAQGRLREESRNSAQGRLREESLSSAQGKLRELSRNALTELAAGGELLWVGEGPRDAALPAANARLRAVRFIRRGTERAWLAPANDPVLSERAAAVLAQLRSRGASFFFELQQASSPALGTHALRDALRELVVAGLVTNDSVDALARVARWRPMFSARDDERDAARWLPADFVRSPNRPVVQRRMSVRRLPKWKRPDREGGDAPWPGRWSLVDRTPIAVPPLSAETLDSANAEVIAKQLLERYGVVSRDWWRREHPPVPWRAIYRELRRMELRGDIRRGYFVQGLAGAQFALPAAVEQLRAAATASGDAASSNEPLVVLPASDPSNVWMLQGAGDPFARPRAPGALLVTRAGQVLLTADARARSVAVRPALSSPDATAAARALISYLAARRSRDIIVETIDGSKAATSPWSQAFVAAGLRLTTRGLRYYATR